jgi:hypothetical protein
MLGRLHHGDFLAALVFHALLPLSPTTPGAGTPYKDTPARLEIPYALGAKSSKKLRNASSLSPRLARAAYLATEMVSVGMLVGFLVCGIAHCQEQLSLLFAHLPPHRRGLEALR